MFKVVVQKFGFVLSLLSMGFTSSVVFGQTVQINPEMLIGPTVLRAGWDIKAWPARLDTEDEARVLLKAEFSSLKEKQLKEILTAKTWLAQNELLEQAQALQKAIRFVNLAMYIIIFRKAQRRRHIHFSLPVVAVV